MSYIEERIKFLAIKSWRNDRSKKEIPCENSGSECDFPLIRASFYQRECRVMCDECGYQQESVPDEVIDAFLDRI